MKKGQFTGMYAKSFTSFARCNYKLSTGNSMIRGRSENYLQPISFRQQVTTFFDHYIKGYYRPFLPAAQIAIIN